MYLRVHFLAEHFSEEHKCCYGCCVGNHINTGGLQCMPASNDFTAFAYFFAFFLSSIFSSIIFLLFRVSGLFSSFLQYFDTIVFVVIFDLSSLPIYWKCEWMIKAIVLIKFVENGGSAGYIWYTIPNTQRTHTSEWNAILTLWCWWWLRWLFSIQEISKWNNLIHFSHSKK